MIRFIIASATVIEVLGSVFSINQPLRWQQSVFPDLNLVTPKAFANFSPWLERSDNHGIVLCIP
jgi:hypothetical protein